MIILQIILLLLSISAMSAIVNRVVCPSVSIIDRSEWNPTNNQTKATKILFPNRVVTFVVIHHTMTDFCSSRNECLTIIKQLEKDQVEILNMKDVGAHFFVGGDDQIYEGRGWGVEGEDVVDCPTCLSIAFIGNFTTKSPSANSKNVVTNLIDCGRRNKMIYDRYSLYGHRDLRVTSCPGDELYNAIQMWQNYAIAGPAIKTSIKSDDESS